MTGTCINCGKSIYYGGTKRTIDEKNWRHVDTGNKKCAGPIPHAWPVEEELQEQTREIAKKQLKEFLEKSVPEKLEDNLLELIQLGIPVTSGGNKETTNALTRLRRRGFIYNEGTRKNPRWILVGPEEPKLPEGKTYSSIRKYLERKS